MLDGRGGREVTPRPAASPASAAPRDCRFGAGLSRDRSTVPEAGFPEWLRQKKKQRQQRVHNYINMTAIRRGGAGDLDAVAAIQGQPRRRRTGMSADYLEQDFWVAR